MVESEELPTIADDLVVTKYKMSAEIVNKVLKELVDACKATGSVRDLCILGDKRLAEETGKAFKKDKKTHKGNRFPHLRLCQQYHLPLLSSDYRA